MRRFETLVVLIGLLNGVLVGCGRGLTPVPPGGQKVHVRVTDSELRLDPATVRAGDVYVVLDTPGSTVRFVQRKRSAEETPGPMSDEDLDRLAHGDPEGTSVGSFDDTGCSADQRADDRGQMGYCGNVFKETLTPGKYAFFLGDAEGVPPRSIAILEVVP